MKNMVVYDSIFGNTEKIAQAIAKGLGDAGLVKVDQAKPEQLAGIQLLIVGSPTRGFRPTPAIAGFLKGIAPAGLSGVDAAAFDTGIAVPDIKPAAFRFIIKLGGYAAKPIANLLEKKGGNLVVSPEGFFVKDSEGPLKEGELERAANWGRQIQAARKQR